MSPSTLLIQSESSKKRENRIKWNEQPLISMEVLILPERAILNNEMNENLNSLIIQEFNPVPITIIKS